MQHNYAHRVIHSRFPATFDTGPGSGNEPPFKTSRLLEPEAAAAPGDEAQLPLPLPHGIHLSCLFEIGIEHFAMTRLEARSSDSHTLVLLQICI